VCRAPSAECKGAASPAPHLLRRLLMNHDAAAAEQGSVGQPALGVGIDLVVIDYDVLLEVRIVIPDFDPESILPGFSIDVPIDRRQQEFVASLAVDGAGPFVLRPSAGDN